MADEKITDFIKEDKPEPTSDSTISAKDELDDFFEEFIR